MHPSFTPHFYLQVHRSLFILLSSLHHILFLLTLYVLPYTNRSILVHPSFFPLPFCLLSFNCIFSSFALFLAFIFASSLLSHLHPVFSSFPFHPFLQLFSTPYHPILTSSLLSLSVFPSPFSLILSFNLCFLQCSLATSLPLLSLFSLLALLAILVFMLASLPQISLPSFSLPSLQPPFLASICPYSFISFLPFILPSFPPCYPTSCLPYLCVLLCILLPILLSSLKC